ncbi:MAG: hypothetical protein JW795_03115, partial [Chitinivibrionales bacterium]|nr:hypothetical protein [Chitinivibrionales bacterium]
AILCADVGAHLHLIGQAWKAYHRNGVLMTNGGSSMGFGLPAACAAAIADPLRQVACVIGDGGFLMMAGELALVTRLQLKIICIVFCDASLSLIRIKQNRKEYGVYGTSLTDTVYNTADLLFGVPVLHADSTSSYGQALSQAIDAQSATLILVKIDSRHYDDLILKGNRN